MTRQFRLDDALARFLTVYQGALPEREFIHSFYSRWHELTTTIVEIGTSAVVTIGLATWIASAVPFDFTPLLKDGLLPGLSFATTSSYKINHFWNDGRPRRFSNRYLADLANLH